MTIDAKVYRTWEVEGGMYGYEAYRKHANGAPLPPWTQLPEATQRAWIDTVADVCMRYGAID